MIDTTHRSNAPELMDDFQLEGEMLRDALDKIARINHLLGGNRVTLEGVRILLQDADPAVTVHLADIGCGNGDMLRMLADDARKRGLKFRMTGIDANAFTIAHARQLSAGYPEISYQCMDIFRTPLPSCDIFLCTLTLHHFTDKELPGLLQQFGSLARLGYVINDLERSAVAYRLFQALCFAFRLNAMSREDGLVSILRGFKKVDLQRYSRQLQLKSFSIRWKWAFRYQWIVKNR